MATLQDYCQKVREVAERIVELRHAGASGEQVRKAVTDGMVLMLQLKASNKDLCLHAEAKREETGGFRTQLDQTYLQLQNLQYEKQYYEKEIRACRSFQSAYTDEQIGLMPVEQFLQSASAEERAKASATSDPHQLMLLRLTHELQARKALVQKLEELVACKASVQQTVTEQRKTLDGLQAQLQALDSAAKPLHNILGPTQQLRLFSSRNAELLPLPLYIIFSQLAASQEALGYPIKVDIAGSVQQAERLAADTAAAAMQEQSDVAAAAAAASVAAPGEKGRHAAAGGQQQEQQRAAKRARRSPSPPPFAREPYAEHPLHVTLDIFDDAPAAAGASLSSGSAAAAVAVAVAAPGKPLLTIKFLYLTNLKLVTASCDDAADTQLLPALFPDDDGTAASLEVLAHLDGYGVRFDGRAAKPYRWAQHLAGMDLLPPLPPASAALLSAGAAGGVLSAGEQATLSAGLADFRKQQRIKALLERVRSVKQAHAALRACLAQLLRKPPALPPPSDTSMYGRSAATAALVLWEEVRTSAAPAKAGGLKPSASQAQLPAGASSRALGSAPPADARLSPTPASLLALPAAAASAAAGGAQPADAPPAAAAANAQLQSREALLKQLASGLGGEDEEEEGAINEDVEIQVSVAAKPDVSQPAGAAAGEEAADEAGIAAAVAGGDAAGDGAAPMDEDGGEGAALLQPYPSARGLPLPPRGGGGLDLTSPVATTARGAVTASPGRLFKAMLRHGNLELSFTVRIHPLYPSHPPSFSSLALLEFPPPEKRKSGAKGVRVGGVNLLTWLEAEANVAALQLVPDGGKRECLQQQLTHLALCLDQLAEGRAADSSADVVRQLAARQQLRGRARLPPPVALLAAETKASVQV